VFKPTLNENFTPEPFDIRIAFTNETSRVPADSRHLRSCVRTVFRFLLRTRRLQ
jgi:hypothetical protein